MTPLPGEILVIAYTITTIDFVWGDSSNEAGFVRDNVTYSPLTANSNFELTGTRRGRLTGLTPGTLYNIRLDVVSSDPQDDTTTQRTGTDLFIFFLNIFLTHIYIGIFFSSVSVHFIQNHTKHDIICFIKK